MWDIWFLNLYTCLLKNKTLWGLPTLVVSITNDNEPSSVLTSMQTKVLNDNVLP